MKIQIIDGKVYSGCKGKTLPQANFPPNNLSFHRRQRWWDQIQAYLLKYFLLYQNLRLTNGRFTTISSHFFTNCNLKRQQKALDDIWCLVFGIYSPNEKNINQRCSLSHCIEQGQKRKSVNKILFTLMLPGLFVEQQTVFSGPPTHLVKSFW